MRKANVLMDRDFAIGQTDPRLFGAFVEHLGRCVYGGIYEPGHETADKKGFRKDVLELVKELGPTIMRYPGGNFVSGYNWEDGVGPVDKRPARLDLAWFTTEPNTFGTNEFMDWCKAASVEPMMAVNLGTRGGDAARNLVEYCNHPGGSYWSDLRRAHGWEKPHGVKFWCLGNEMDGPWQMEYKTAGAYGAVAREAAKMMRWIDPGIELAACGSSSRNMPSFGHWEDTVIEHTFDHAEYISLHTYLNNYRDDTASFLASPDLMDRFIDEVVAIADSVAAKRRSAKRMMLSFDEWNVWYRTRRNRADRVKEGWPVAPPILEEIYTMEDALAFGGACISLLNHADRVKTACLAQLVNVIAPIMTETGGPAWRQTIFFPFAQMSKFGRGKVLRAQIESETYDSAYYDPRGTLEQSFAVPNVPYLKLAAVATEAGGLSLFLLNRDLGQEIEVSLEARSFGKLTLGEALELRHDDLKATNTKDEMGRVKPAPLKGVTVDGGRIRVTLKPASWNVIHLTETDRGNSDRAGPDVAGLHSGDVKMLDRKSGPKERARPAPKAKGIRSFLNVDPEQQFEIVRGLASPVRVRILRLLRRRGPLNVNQISEALALPQSTIATNIQILEESELIDTEIGRARKGQQKICTARFDEIVIRLDGEETSRQKDIIEVEMPLGLYTSYNVSAPCGLCSTEGIMGVLDVPDLFLDPCRVQAALIWFGRGHVEYKFPNNAKVLNAKVEALEFALELSSEVPGTNANWPSDISLWVNDVKVGTWTSPGDYGDRRGVHTPRWWKLEGSQYGALTQWHISSKGTYMGAKKLSSVTLAQLELAAHHSIRLRVGIDDNAAHPGGVNIFGRGFGNHNHDILMRLHLK